MLAIASICVQSRSQRDVSAFQSALTQAVGSNINCSVESDTGGQLGRDVSDVCAHAAKIINSNNPDRRITDRVAFICPTAYSNFLNFESPRWARAFDDVGFVTRP